MMYSERGISIGLVSVALVLAVVPAQAQTSASANKFLLDPNPPSQFIEAATLKLVHQIRPDLGGILVPPDMQPPAAATPTAAAPPVAPPGPNPAVIQAQQAAMQAQQAAMQAQQAAMQAQQAAVLQGILTGIGAIQAAVDSGPPAPRPPTGAAATPAKLTAMITERVERLRREKREAVLGAAESTRLAAIAGDTAPTASGKQPPAPAAGPATPPPAAATAPPSTSKMEAAMVADLVNRPDVVAAVRDMHITAALKGWEDAFSAAWPDYAANNAYHPSVYFYGSYAGDALAIMPDGSTSTGSLSIAVDFVDNIVAGGMNFVSSNPNLAGNLTFTEWFLGDWGRIEDNAAAFGGTLGDGEWTGGYYGAGGEIMAGNWSATITGGPNAGTVIGKFGGQQ